MDYFFWKAYLSTIHLLSTLLATFAMVVSLLLRRAQLLLEGKPDPYSNFIHLSSSSRDSTTTGPDVFKFEGPDTQNRAILRLVYVLEKGLRSKMSPRSAIEWALARGQLIDDLKNAILGNYKVILQLTSVLQHGSQCKKVVDSIIDKCEALFLAKSCWKHKGCRKCLIHSVLFLSYPIPSSSQPPPYFLGDAMTNLREVILMHRVEYSNTGEISSLEKAFGCLERYFVLQTFASYVNENSQAGFANSFSQWLQARPGKSLVLFQFHWLKGIWNTLTLFPKIIIFNYGIPSPLRNMEYVGLFTTEGTSSLFVSTRGWLVRFVRGKWSIWVFYLKFQANGLRMGKIRRQGSFYFFLEKRLNWILFKSTFSFVLYSPVKEAFLFLILF